MEEDGYDILFKIILVGDTSVGKTNIISKYLKNLFQEDFSATIGVEFSHKQFLIDNHKIKAQIWDTAGQERYKAITKAYYKGAKGAFIVYDISRKNTFDSISRWVSDITATADKKITLILIGNKSDLEDQRQVTKEQGEEKAKEFGLAFLETSASSGDNLEKAFSLMINEVYKKCQEDINAETDDNVVDQGKDITLNKPAGKTEKKKCC
jgi:Ras-related protein Rab-11A